ncbi:MAG: hypothetical protein V2A64_01215 [Candidatus Omnitrophota bacterium]
MNIRFLSLIFFTGVLITDVFAGTGDTIKLKNGRKIEGRLKEISNEDVVLEISGGVVCFAREEVGKINGLSIEEFQAKSSIKDTVVSRDKNKAAPSFFQDGLNFVSKTRRLLFKNTPEMEITSPGGIKEQRKKAVEKYCGKEKLQSRAKLLLKLGVIIDSEDYIRQLLESAAEEAASYYSFDDKKMYAAEDVLRDAIPILPNINIMRELVYALQDQYYKIRNLEGMALLKNEDKDLAVQSVINGDAILFIYDAFVRAFKSAGPEAAASVKNLDLRSFVIEKMLSDSKRLKIENDGTTVFIEEVLFSSVLGGKFLQYTVNTQGWKAVEKIYADLPVSSEQIIHPEKYYILRDNPKEIDFPNAAGILGKSWTKLSQGTLGEFGVYLIGKKFLDELSNKVMSEGWGGDRFEFYEEMDTKKTLFLCITKWDSPQEADEFFSFYKKILAKKYKQLILLRDGVKTKDSARFFQWNTEERNVYFSKSKDTVVVIEGAPDKLVGSLIENFH